MRAQIWISAVALLVAGCDKKKSSEPSPPKPVAGSGTTATTDPSTPKKFTPPAACASYVAAVEKLRACPTVDADTKDTFLRIFAQDEEPISGARSAPASALETLCTARLQNVESVLASQCGAPLAERSVAELQAELEKTTAALTISETFANDPKQSDDLRAKSKARAAELAKEKAEIEQLIAKKKAEPDPGQAKRLEGITVPEECVKNPLAKGCT